jgi:hypothetical protein
MAAPADLAGAIDSIEWKAISGALEHAVTAVSLPQSLPGILTLTVVLSPESPVLIPMPLVITANGRASSLVIFTLRP